MLEQPRISALAGNKAVRSAPNSPSSVRRRQAQRAAYLSATVDGDSEPEATSPSSSPKLGGRMLSRRRLKKIGEEVRRPINYRASEPNLAEFGTTSAVHSVSAIPLRLTEGQRGSQPATDNAGSIAAGPVDACRMVEALCLALLFHDRQVTRKLALLIARELHTLTLQPDVASDMAGGIPSELYPVLRTNMIELGEDLSAQGLLTLQSSSAIGDGRIEGEAAASNNWTISALLRPSSGEGRDSPGIIPAIPGSRSSAAARPRSMENLGLVSSTSSLFALLSRPGDNEPSERDGWTYAICRVLQAEMALGRLGMAPLAWACAFRMLQSPQVITIDPGALLANKVKVGPRVVSACVETFRSLVAFLFSAVSTDNERPLPGLDTVLQAAPRSGGMDYQLDTASFFKFILPFLKSEQDHVREAMVDAAEQLPATVYPQFMEVLTNYQREAMELRSESVRKRRRRDVMRVSVVQIFERSAATAARCLTGLSDPARLILAMHGFFNSMLSFFETETAAGPDNRLMMVYFGRCIHTLSVCLASDELHARLFPAQLRRRLDRFFVGQVPWLDRDKALRAAKAQPRTSASPRLSTALVSRAAGGGSVRSNSGIFFFSSQEDLAYDNDLSAPGTALPKSTVPPPFAAAQGASGMLHNHGGPGHGPGGAGTVDKAPEIDRLFEGQQQETRQEEGHAGDYTALASPNAVRVAATAALSALCRAAQFVDGEDISDSTAPESHTLGPYASAERQNMWLTVVEMSTNASELQAAEEALTYMLRRPDIRRTERGASQPASPSQRRPLLANIVGGFSQETIASWLLRTAYCHTSDAVRGAAFRALSREVNFGVSEGDVSFVEALALCLIFVANSDPLTRVSARQALTNVLRRSMPQICLPLPAALASASVTVLHREDQEALTKVVSDFQPRLALQMALELLRRFEHSHEAMHASLLRVLTPWIERLADWELPEGMFNDQYMADGQNSRRSSTNSSPRRTSGFEGAFPPSAETEDSIDHEDKPAVTALVADLVYLHGSCHALHSGALGRLWSAVARSTSLREAAVDFLLCEGQRRRGTGFVTCSKSVLLALVCAKPTPTLDQLMFAVNSPDLRQAGDQDRAIGAEDGSPLSMSGPSGDEEAAAAGNDRHGAHGGNLTADTSSAAEGRLLSSDDTPRTQPASPLQVRNVPKSDSTPRPSALLRQSPLRFSSRSATDECADTSNFSKALGADVGGDAARHHASSPGEAPLKPATPSRIRVDGSGDSFDVPLHSRRTPYTAPLDKLFPQTNQVAAFTDGYLSAIVLLVEVVAHNSQLNWHDYLGDLLHASFLGLDHSNVTYQHHCKQLIINLVHVYSLRAFGASGLASGRTQVLMESICNTEPLWHHEDITVANVELVSEGQLAQWVERLLHYFADTQRRILRQNTSDAVNNPAAFGQSSHEYDSSRHDSGASDGRAPTAAHRAALKSASAHHLFVNVTDGAASASSGDEGQHGSPSRTPTQRRRSRSYDGKRGNLQRARGATDPIRSTQRRAPGLAQSHSLNAELIGGGRRSQDASAEAHNLLPMAELRGELGSDRPSLRQLWGTVALQWATLCPNRHLASRSFQILRALRPDVSDTSLGSILMRLADVVADPSPQAQNYAADILLTLRKVVEQCSTPHSAMARRASRLLPRVFWAAVALFESNFEHEFKMAATVVVETLRAGVLRDTTCRDVTARLYGELGWDDHYPGLHALVLRGLTSRITEGKTLELLSLLTSLMMSPVVNRLDSLCLNICALVPILVFQFEADARDPMWTTAALELSKATRATSSRLSKLFALYAEGQYPKDRSSWVADLAKFFANVFFPHRDLCVFTFLVQQLQSGNPSLVGPNVTLLSALLKTLRSDPESRVRGCADDLVAVIIRLQRQGMWPEALTLLEAASFLADDTRHVEATEQPSAGSPPKISARLDRGGEDGRKEGENMAEGEHDEGQDPLLDALRSWPRWSANREVRAEPRARARLGNVMRTCGAEMLPSAAVIFSTSSEGPDFPDNISEHAQGSAGTSRRESGARETRGLERLDAVGEGEMGLDEFFDDFSFLDRELEGEGSNATLSAASLEPLGFFPEDDEAGEPGASGSAESLSAGRDGRAALLPARGAAEGVGRAEMRRHRYVAAVREGPDAAARFGDVAEAGGQGESAASSRRRHQEAGPHLLSRSAACIEEPGSLVEEDEDMLVATQYLSVRADRVDAVWSAHVAALLRDQTGAVAVQTGMVARIMARSLAQEQARMTREACALLRALQPETSTVMMAEAESLEEVLDLPLVYLDTESLSAANLLPRLKASTFRLHQLIQAYLQGRRAALAQLKQAQNDAAASSARVIVDLCRQMNELHLHLVQVALTYTDVLVVLEEAAHHPLVVDLSHQVCAKNELLSTARSEERKRERKR